MELEWDDEKNRANRAKHGLDFEDARNLDWDTAMYVEDTRFEYPDRRYWAFAMKDGRLHMVAFCLRAASVRIISFRKPNRKGGRLYGAKS
ncbi:MAG TPA: BrnT family toxin [Rhizomicrobium sp.]